MMVLPAMEIRLNETGYLLLVVSNVCPQGAVIEGAQLAYDAVNHRCAEHPMLLIYRTLALQAVGRGGARVGQLCQCGKLVGIGSIVDVDIHIVAGGDLQGVLHLKAVATGDTEAGQ